jgi:hypothetical protein
VGCINDRCCFDCSVHCRHNRKASRNAFVDSPSGLFFTLMFGALGNVATAAVAAITDVCEHSSEFAAVVLPSRPAFAPLNTEPLPAFAVGGTCSTALWLRAVLPHAVGTDLQPRRWNTGDVNETVTELSNEFNSNRTTTVTYVDAVLTEALRVQRELTETVANVSEAKQRSSISHSSSMASSADRHRICACGRQSDNGGLQ